MLDLIVVDRWRRLASEKRWLQVAAWAGIFALAYLCTLFIHGPGSDWNIFFAVRNLPDFPPWIELLMWPVRSLRTQNALTLTMLGYALWRYQARPIHYLLAFTTIPVFWNLWLGQIDCLPLLGMIWLTWDLPLAAAKPQVAIWGALAWWLRRPDRRRIAVIAAGGIALSLVVYGWWPARLQLPTAYFTAYNLSAWHWGGVVAGVTAVAFALLLTFRARDIDASMALGSLAAPLALGNSYLLLLPGLARLSGWPLSIAWLASWIGLVALVLGDVGRPLIALLPVVMWAPLTWSATRPAAADFRVSKPAT